MTKLEVKEILSKYKRIKKREEQLKQRLAEQNFLMRSMKTANYSGIKVKGSFDNYALDKVIDQKTKIENALQTTIIEKCATREIIYKFLNQLDNSHYDVDILIDKYINLLDTSALKRKYNYDKQVIYNKISLSYKKLMLIDFVP